MISDLSELKIMSYSFSKRHNIFISKEGKKTKYPMINLGNYIMTSGISTMRYTSFGLFSGKSNTRVSTELLLHLYQNPPDFKKKNFF